MGGSKWREPQYTPDWTDCMIAIQAVQELHQVTIIVQCSTGVFSGPVGFTTVLAFKHSMVGEASVLGEPLLALSAEWPCKDHKDYYACLLSAIYNLDSKLSDLLWVQKKLEFTQA